jgi:hypothetical protein
VEVALCQELLSLTKLDSTKILTKFTSDMKFRISRAKAVLNKKVNYFVSNLDFNLKKKIFNPLNK